MVMLVPPPSTESISTWPPDCFTKPCTIDRPSPVPRPTCLVVKNGSNTRAKVAASMPWPLSRTRSITYSPGEASGNNAA